MKPEDRVTIADPAQGSGGFLLSKVMDSQFESFRARMEKLEKEAQDRLERIPNSETIDGPSRLRDKLGQRDTSFCVRFSTFDTNRVDLLREFWRQRTCSLRWYTFQWDDDPRELWEIPQAIQLCRDLIAEGWLAVLHPGDADGMEFMGTGLLLVAIADCRPGKPISTTFPKQRFLDMAATSIKQCEDRFGK